jgi:hypothetical protein
MPLRLVRLRVVASDDTPYMCNLYSEAKGQAGIRGLFRSAHDRTGNLPAFPGIFPDQLAPIVRNSRDDEREMVHGVLGHVEPVLARMAFGKKPIPRANIVSRRPGRLMHCMARPDKTPIDVKSGWAAPRLGRA